MRPKINAERSGAPDGKTDARTSSPQEIWAQTRCSTSRIALIDSLIRPSPPSAIATVESNGKGQTPRRLRVGILAMLCGLLTACAGLGLNYSPTIGRALGLADFARPAFAPFPENNPHSPERAELGRTLFFDTGLSHDGTMSCASCHDPVKGYEDGRTTARGADGQTLKTHTPTLWNVAWGRSFRWDGSVRSLDEQSLNPIRDHAEMRQNLDQLAARLAADPTYAAAFRTAFPGERRITPRLIGQALGTFQRTLVSPETSFDRFVIGDATALTPEAARGFGLFTGKANCAACHTGWNFTDGKRHDIGLRSAPGRSVKTPTLREIGHRAPYMHDGSLTTLEAVVDHYADLDPKAGGGIRPVALSPAERREIVAFLQSITSSPSAEVARDR